MHDIGRFLRALCSYRCTCWIMAIVFCLGSTAHAFQSQGYVKIVPQGSAHPYWGKISHINKQPSGIGVTMVGGNKGGGVISASRMRSICRIKQACLAALAVSGVSSAIGYYYWQLGQEPAFNTFLGREECLRKFERVAGYIKETMNIPCGGGNFSQYTLVGDYNPSVGHGDKNSYGETVRHYSIAWRSRLQDYKFPYLKDTYTEIKGSANSTRFRNQAVEGGQTLEQYLADEQNVITPEQWMDAAEASNGTVLQTGTALDGLPVYGTVTVTDTSSLTQTDYLTEAEVEALGLSDTSTGVKPGNEAVEGGVTSGGESGEESEPESALSSSCGTAPLPPCEVNVKNWPQSPSDPDFILGENEGLTERIVNIGTFDYGTGWLPRGCPAPVSISTPYGGVEFSYQWICQFTTAIAPLTILAALLAGLSIVFGSQRRVA